VAEDPRQDPSTFDPDEDLFNFDEVALDFYSSNDEEDLEEIFQAFEGDVENELGFGFEAVDEPANPEPPRSEPAVAEDPAPALEETFRADPVPAAPPAPTPIEDPLPMPETRPTSGPVPSQPPVAQPAAPLPTGPTSAHPALPQPLPAPTSVPNVLPPQVHPRPASQSTTEPLSGMEASRHPLMNRLRGASPILLAVTVMNLLLAIVVLKRPSTTDAPQRTVAIPEEQEVPDVQATYEASDPPPTAAPQPDRHPTFALANEEISRGEYGAARRRIYGLLSIIDRLDTNQRAEIEARAQYLLAEAHHLEALARLEERR